MLSRHADATISPAGLRIMKLLVGNPPQTVAELIRAAGVTRTAVTEQLNELVAAGFVERDTQRLPGRGRPRHLYRATDAALVLLFASNQRLVVPAIWRAILDVGGEELTQEGPQAGQPRDGRALQQQDHRQEAARTAPPVHRPAGRRGRAGRGRGRRRRAIGAPQAELPLHQHGRRPAKRLPHRPGDAERGGRAAGPPDGLPPRRRPVLHVRDRRASSNGRKRCIARRYPATHLCCGRLRDASAATLYDADMRSSFIIHRSSFAMATAYRTDAGRAAARVSSEILDRLPPHNLDAEKGVLGSLLLDPNLCDDVALVLRPDDFYAEANQKLYAHLLAMHDEGGRIDATLLLERLRPAGDLEADRRRRLSGRGRPLGPLRRQRRLLRRDRPRQGHAAGVDPRQHRNPPRRLRADARPARNGRPRRGADLRRPRPAQHRPDHQRPRPAGRGVRPHRRPAASTAKAWACPPASRTSTI